MRLTTVTGATDIDEGLRFLRDVVLPQRQLGIAAERGFGEDMVLEVLFAAL